MPPKNEKIFSPEELAVITESVKRSEKIIAEKLKGINWLMTGVVIVLFIGFITMLIALGGILWQAMTFQSNSYQALVDEVKETKNAVDNISKKIEKFKK